MNRHARHTILLHRVHTTHIMHHSPPFPDEW